MKIFRFGPIGAEQPGIVDTDGQLRDASAPLDGYCAADLANGFARLRGTDVADLPLLPLETRLSSPIPMPGKYVCVGLNYRDHAKESGMELPREPILFMKATSAICGPNDDLLVPREATKVDWEVELAVVIGRAARYVAEGDALDHVAGFCVAHDVSERSFQLERGGQWDKGKGCDTFGPLGPYLVTIDSMPPLSRLNLWLDVNGKPMQRGNTSDMVFSVPHLIHYISQFMTLLPGDVIATGTPAGVGLGRKPQQWLTDGDVVTLGIDGLGEQRQLVRTAEQFIISSGNR